MKKIDIDEKKVNMQIKKPGVAFGIVSLVIGLVSIPSGVFYVGIVFAIIGAVFGIVALIRREQIAIALPGIAFSTLGGIIACVMIVLSFSIVMDEININRAIKSGDKAKFEKSLNAWSVTEGNKKGYYYEWYCSQQEYNEAAKIVLDQIQSEYANKLHKTQESFIDRLVSIQDNLTGETKNQVLVMLENIENAKKEEQERIEKEEQEKLAQKKAEEQASIEAEKQASIEAERQEQLNKVDTENVLSARDTVDAYYAALVSADYKKAITFCMEGNDNYDSINALLDENLSDLCLSLFLEDDGNSGGAVDEKTVKKIAKNKYFLQLMRIANETRFSGNYTIGDKLSESDDSAEYLVNAERIISQSDFVSYMMGDQSNIFYKYYYDNPEKVEKLSEKGIEYLFLGIFESKYAEELVASYRESIYENAVYEDAQYKVTLVQNNEQWKIVSVDRIETDEADDMDYGWYDEDEWYDAAEDDTYYTYIRVTYDVDNIDDAVNYVKLFVDGEEWGEVYREEEEAAWYDFLTKGTYSVQLEGDEYLQNEKTNEIKITVEEVGYYYFKVFQDSQGRLQIIQEQDD